MSLTLNEDNTEFVGKNLALGAEVASFPAINEYIVGVRVDLGKVTGYLNVNAAQFIFVAKVDGNQIYSDTVSKAGGAKVFFYNFDRQLLLNAGEVLTVEVTSNNPGDISISGDVFIFGIRSSGGTLAVTQRSDMVDWIKTEFLPLEIITPVETINQQIDNAIRYWNTHSGYKVMQTIPYFKTGKRMQLSPEFKTVVQVYPGQTTTWIWNDHPLWTVLGITILDNLTTDLILMSEAFRNYRIYVGTDFRWVFEKSDDATQGGYLYAINVPSGVTSLTVVGTKRILEGEVIKIDYVQDFTLRYAKALVQCIEGNTLRKSPIIDIKDDGQAMIDEGRQDLDKLKEELAENGRWVVLASRK